MGKTTRVSAGLERIMGSYLFFLGAFNSPLFFRLTAQEALSFSFLLGFCILELKLARTAYEAILNTYKICLEYSAKISNSTSFILNHTNFVQSCQIVLSWKLVQSRKPFSALASNYIGFSKPVSRRHLFGIKPYPKAGKCRVSYMVP